MGFWPVMNMLTWRLGRSEIASGDVVAKSSEISLVSSTISDRFPIAGRTLGLERKQSTARQHQIG